MENLHPALKEMVIDLRYRGDYDGETRKVVQLHLVNNDLDGFFKALSDESFWRRGRPVETPFEQQEESRGRLFRNADSGRGSPFLKSSFPFPAARFCEMFTARCSGLISFLFL